MLPKQICLKIQIKRYLQSRKINDPPVINHRKRNSEKWRKAGIPVFESHLNLVAVYWLEFLTSLL